MIEEYIKKTFRTQLYHKASSRAYFTLGGLVFKELTASFPQFFSWQYPFSSFFRSIKYFLLALVRIPLGKNVKVSYSFTGEDRLIESLLKPIITQNGFYVDLGCNDPRFISNSFLFYKRGWRGICIDANTELINKHKRIRPRDQAVCALVSDQVYETEFIQLTNNVLSSADLKYLEEMKSTGQEIISVEKMTSKTLTQILDECNAPSQIDFLSVDIEEFDYKALKSLDFNKYKPRLIITEAEDFDPENPNSHPVYTLLKSKGYALTGSILTNLYFMKK